MLTGNELVTRRAREEAIALPHANLNGRAACETVLVKFRDERHVAALRVARGQGKAAATVLAQRPDVAFAEVDRVLRRQSSSNDPLFAQQWHHGMIRSADAWDYAPGGTSVRIAIVDYVFQMNHPDLAGNVDTGWDVVNKSWVFPYQIPAVYPYDDHATLSAGMAAAVTGNAVGVAGAGNCRVLPVRINGNISEMYQATVWAASNGVRVVSISWDGADSPTLNEAGRVLREEIDGILVMAGVNGTGRLEYPDHPYITAVSMTDEGDTLRSHHGPHIDFAAPGWQVVSTTTVGGYGTDSGTSYAAPLVSGVLAALLAVDPSVTAEKALLALRRSAVDLGTPGRDEHYGWGRIDFADAAWLTALMAGLAPEILIEGMEIREESCAVDVEFHRGLGYCLETKSRGITSDWAVLPSTVSTGSSLVTVSASLGSTGGYYRVKVRLP